MTSLRDIRLWLIIALAVLCLIAVRNCTINYQNGSQDSAVSETEATASDAEVAKSESGNADSAKVAETDEETATEANQLVSQTEQSEASAKSAVSEGGNQNAADSSAEGNAEAAVASAEKQDAAESQPAEADTDSASEPETTDAAVSATVNATSEQATESEAPADSAGTTVQSGTTTDVKVIKREIVEFKLGEVSKTGEFGVDLANDIATVREGLTEYGGRIGSLRQTIEKVRSAM